MFDIHGKTEDVSYIQQPFSIINRRVSHIQYGTNNGWEMFS